MVENKRMFDFTELKQGTKAYYKLSIAKFNYIVDEYEAGTPIREITKAMGETKTVTTGDFIHKYLAWKDLGVRDKEFFRAFLGKPYDILMRNGIKTFKQLEKTVKKDHNFENLVGIGPVYRALILDIYWDWARKKSVLKGENGDKKAEKQSKKRSK